MVFLGVLGVIGIGFVNCFFWLFFVFFVCVIQCKWKLQNKKYYKTQIENCTNEILYK